MKRALVLTFSTLILFLGNAAFAVQPVRSHFQHYFSWLPLPEITRFRLKPESQSIPVELQTTCPLPSHSVLLRGTSQNAGFVTLELAECLKSRNFRDHSSFVRAFWKAVSRSGHAGEFSPENYDRMIHGRAPIAPESQHFNGKTTYRIRQIPTGESAPIHYDLCNMMIATPLYLEEVRLLNLEPLNAQRADELR